MLNNPDIWAGFQRSDWMAFLGPGNDRVIRTFESEGPVIDPPPAHLL